MDLGLFFDVPKWGTGERDEVTAQLGAPNYIIFHVTMSLIFPFSHSRIKFPENFEKFWKFLFFWRIYFQSEESESVKNLFEGVKNDSIDQIRAALSDCDVNARRNGRTALHNAVMRSTPKVISFLIEQGANVNALWNVISLYDLYMMRHFFVV